MIFQFRYKGAPITVQVDAEDAELLEEGSGWYVGLKSRGRLYVVRNRRRDSSGELYLHREIARRKGLKLGGLRVDHLNGDPLDNRRANLRTITHAKNIQNRSAAEVGSQTGVLGVSPKRGKFRASIRHEGRQVHLGTFSTIDAAATARRSAEMKYRGELAAAWR